VKACDACLRRAQLLRLLAPRIAELSAPKGRSKRVLLALPDVDLVYAVAGTRAEEVLAELEAFDPREMRDEMTTSGLSATCRHDAAYPSRLRQLADPPSPLFLLGDTSVLAGVEDEPAVAIVGARRASTYALEVAHELGRGLAVSGLTVVSGLALGVDGAAHRGALAGRGQPLAVLGSGADVPYPSSHRSLYRRVAETGLVVSELPPGAEARRWAFPARNRIMAALAEMVIVVEARKGSGTLITADFAADLQCQLGVVPGRVTAAGAAGSNALLVDGARPILGVQDVLDGLYGVGNRESPPPVRVSLDGIGRAVLDVVEAGDSPLETGEWAVKDVRAALGRLEVLGLVRRDGLGGYERTGVECEPA
jgi:DNA processing protein